MKSIEYEEALTKDFLTQMSVIKSEVESILSSDKLDNPTKVAKLKAIEIDQYSPLITDLISTRSQNAECLGYFFTEIAKLNFELGNLTGELHYYTGSAVACQYVLNIISNIQDSQSEDQLRELSKLRNNAYEKLNAIQTLLVEACSGNLDMVQKISKEEDINDLSKKDKLQTFRSSVNEKVIKIEEYKLAKDITLYIEESANLFKSIAENMEEYLAALYQEAEKIMGQPPCKYAVMGLGSMALRQMTPYSDLEFVILTADEKYKENADPKIKEYFRNLSHLVNFKIINLGETIIPTSKYGVDLGHLVHRAVNFDLGGKTPIGREDKPYELIKTVDWMLYYLRNQDNKISHIDKNLPYILEKVCYVYGDRSLVDQYQEKVKHFLFEEKDNTGKLNCEVRALKILQEGVVEISYLQQGSSSIKPITFKGDLDKLAPKLYENTGRLFNVKQEIYRLPDRLVYNLGLIYGVQEESGWDTIRVLSERGIINSTAEINLKKALSFATTIRLKAYGHYGYQKETVDYNKTYNRNQDKAEKLKAALTKLYSFSSVDLEAEGALFEYYKTTLPLLKKLEAFCQSKDIEQKDRFFIEEEFYSNSHGTLAEIHLRLLQYEEFLQHQIEITEQLKTKYGEISQNFAQSLNNVGSAHIELGQYQQALECYSKSLTILKQVLGENHLDVAMNLSNAGLVHRELGQYQQALECYKQTLMILERNLGGENYPDIAINLNHLGDIYRNMEKYQEAEECHKKALMIAERTLGKEHLEAALSRNYLGLIYNELGKYHEALSYCQQALEIRQKILGREHKDVAGSLNNIGAVSCKLGKYDEALKNCLDSLKILKNILGNEHPEIARGLHNVGNIYSELGENQKALEKHLLALTIFKQTLGDSHPDIATTLGSIGTAHAGLKQYHKALECHQQALKIKQKILGEEHSDTAQSLHNIGATYADLEQYEMSVKYYQQALTIFKKSLGENHPLVSLTTSNLGAAYAELGRQQQALECFLEETLKLNEKIAEKEYLDVSTQNEQSIKFILTIMSHRGKECYLEGNYEKAIEYFTKILDLPNMQGNVTVLYNIARSYHQSHDSYNAVHYYHKVLLHDANHAKTLGYLQELRELTINLSGECSESDVGV